MTELLEPVDSTPRLTREPCENAGSDLAHPGCCVWNKLPSNTGAAALETILGRKGLEREVKSLQHSLVHSHRPSSYVQGQQQLQVQMGVDRGVVAVLVSQAGGTPGDIPCFLRPCVP